MLGFDGLDYGLTRRLIDEGKLPNMARMERSGQFAPLETSIPPESPVAWSNFITGMDPGGHGIFDFVHRDPATMMPYASDSKAGEEGFTLKLGKWKFPLTGGGYESLRKGEPFWQALEDHGIESWVLRMPANYPPSGTATRELSGHGHARSQRRALLLVLHLGALLPHRGTDRRRRLRVGRLRRHGGAEALRPRQPAAPRGEAADRRLQGLRRARDPTAKFEVEDSSEFVLKVGEWSDWVPIEFAMIPGKTLHAICRFYLKAVEPELEVYVSPINYDPMAPDAPISTPASYATELAEASGRFYTQGMPEDTKSFTEGVLEIDQFLEQARYAGHEFIAQYDCVLDDFPRARRASSSTTSATPTRSRT